MMPRIEGPVATLLRVALQRTGYDLDGVRAMLGPDAHAALGRSNPVPARLACRDGGELGTLIRLLLLGDELPIAEVGRALDPLTLEDALSAGLVRRAPGGVRAALDLRPHGDDAGSWWVVSDLDPTGRVEPAPADHVVGIGMASLSLARATSRRRVGSLLDLGTGCGVQALHATSHADAITATDVSPRALAMARATFALNALDVELLEGSWFAPVAGRRFDQIVSNPPFVVGRERVDHVYRDSGFAGDGASEYLLRNVAHHLADGGTAHLLASWIHRAGADWRDRVGSWLPATGVDAWVVQRDVADPGLYVDTWLTDSGIDPATPEGRPRAESWLAWFGENEVAGVGFGYVSVRATGALQSTVVCEDLSQQWDDPLGPETAAWFDRIAWLRSRTADDLLDTAFVLTPVSRLTRVQRPGPDGWADTTAVLDRVDGPGWRHDVDDWGQALLAGCTGALDLGELLGLLGLAHDRPVDELRAAAVPVVRDLVLHGMLAPREGL